MTREKELELQSKYPKIFKNLYGDPVETCMHWGFEHGDGWYDLIDRLCHFLQWNTDKNGYPQLVADQVKEKFGELRFYYHYEDAEGKRDTEYLEGAIHFAEIIAGNTCEICGKPGKVEGKQWLACRCEEHKKE